MKHLRFGLAMAVLAGGCTLGSPAKHLPGQQTSTNHPHARVIHRYFEEVWNQGRLDVLDELLTPDYLNHSASTANPQPGPRGLKPIVAAMRSAFPDLHYTIDDLVVGDSAAAVRVTLTGTHAGDFFGTPATGKKVRVSQMNIEQFRGGRIAQHWRVTDELSLMRQLGLIPPGR